MWTEKRLLGIGGVLATGGWGRLALAQLWGEYNTWVPCVKGRCPGKGARKGDVLVSAACLEDRSFQKTKINVDGKAQVRFSWEPEISG